MNLRGSAIVLSLVAVGAIWTEDWLNCDQTVAAPRLHLHVRSLALASTATIEKSTSPTPLPPYELDGNKHDDLMAQEQRELERWRRDKGQ